MEEWKDISGFEGMYKVSNTGRVLACDRTEHVYTIHGIKHENTKVRGGKELKPRPGNGRYYRVVLFKDGVRHDNLIHRLVANMFISNPDNKPYVNHINNNSHNNCVSNLEWCTHKENMNKSKRNRFVTYKDNTKTCSEWGIIFGIPGSEIARRIRSGWSIEKALLTKVKSTR